MTAFRHRIVSRHRFAWLLWLALLLPLAQGAAAWHALSHTGAELAGEADGKSLHVAIHCDLCLTAAAVTGGAAPALPPSLPALPVRHVMPVAAPPAAWVAAPAHAYDSRAPPIASH